MNVAKTAGKKDEANRSAAPKEGRRERNKREKRARIVDAARKLFRAKGYADTTTQEIAEAADIGTGTLFLYVKSKEDLLVLVFEDEMHELIERVFRKTPDEAPLIEQVKALFDGFIAYHRRDVEIAQALIRELTFLSNPERHKEINRIPQAIIEKLAIFVTKAQERGEIRADIDPEMAGRCLFSVYYQHLQFWLGGYASHDVFKHRLYRLIGFMLDTMRAPTRGALTE